LGHGLDEGGVWNAVVALAGEALPLGGNGASVTYALCDAPAAGSWLAAIELAGMQASFLVHVTDFPFRALFDIDLEVADLGGLPDGLRQAVLEGMFASIRAEVLPADADPPIVSRQGLASGFDGYRNAGFQWLAVKLLRPDKLVIGLDIGCERAILARFLADKLPRDLPVNTALAQKIMIPADTTIGSISLACGELKALEPGAVAVMAEQPAGSLTIRVQDRLFDFAPAEGGWCCSGTRLAEAGRARATVHDRGDPMNDKPNFDADADPSPGVDAGSGEAAEADALAGFSVAIDFDIGRSFVSLAELSQWREGTLVALAPPMLADGLAVTIRANGDVVGSGDIVRIDDRIAVRITRFVPRG
jgi:flagellar motor switch/type III secretory pathway protein FliN